VDGEGYISDPQAPPQGNERVTVYELPAVETNGFRVIHHGSYSRFQEGLRPAILSWIEANGYNRRWPPTARSISKAKGTATRTMRTCVSEIQFPVIKSCLCLKPGFVGFLGINYDYLISLASRCFSKSHLLFRGLS